MRFELFPNPAMMNSKVTQKLNCPGGRVSSFNHKITEMTSFPSLHTPQSHHEDQVCPVGRDLQLSMATASLGRATDPESKVSGGACCAPPSLSKFIFSKAENILFIITGADLL